MEMDKTLKQPDKNDPQEISIRNVLEILRSTSWAKSFFNESKKLQIMFLKKTIRPSVANKTVRTQYLDLLKIIGQKGNVRIVEGERNLSLLKTGPLIVVVNHLGTAKITRISTKDLQLKKCDVEEIEPFPIRVTPIFTISQKLSLEIHECAVELPEPFSQIQKECGVITISTNKGGRTISLMRNIKDIVKSNPDSLFVMYPEGGTSGKRNHGNLYDLDKFHTGAFVISKELKIPILPIVQRFDPQRGFTLSILSPIFPENLEETLNFQQIAEKTRNGMQNALDQNKIPANNLDITLPSGIQKV